MFRFIVIGTVILAIIAAVLYYFFGQGLFKSKPPEKKEVTLNVWGLWEEESLIKPAILEYKKTHPDVTLNYKMNTSQNYRSRIQTQIDANQGPDIFLINNAWLPMFTKKGQVAASTAEVMSLDEFNKAFYPVVKEDFTNYKEIKESIDENGQIPSSEKQKRTDEQFLKQGKIYGLPRGIDGLALYYNEDILKAGGINPPTTWNEFRDGATRATVVDQNGVIQTAGAALGLTGNVDHWSDIIGLLFMQQPGANIEVPANQEGADILKFYNDFVKDEKTKVWDSTMESSTQAFAQGKLAFYFGPSWRAHELRQVNPQLNFKIVEVPQLGGRKVGWANYWGYVVSSKSPNTKEAWEFIKFLTSSDTQKLLYGEAAKVRLFGLPYSRVELQKELLEDPLAGAFVRGGSAYKSWYLNSATRDQGLNDEMIKYFEDAINTVSGGSDPKFALETAGKGVQQVLDKYVRETQASPSP